MGRADLFLETVPSTATCVLYMQHLRRRRSLPGSMLSNAIDRGICHPPRYKRLIRSDPSNIYALPPTLITTSQKRVGNG